MGNSEPEAGTQVTGSGPLTASSAVTSKVTMAPALRSASTVRILAGTFTRGGPSTTVTTNAASPTSCVLGSTAVHSTRLSPSGKTLPEAGAQSTVAGWPSAVVALTW